jgi:hypothetical protein
MIGLPGLRNRKAVAQRSAGELDAMAAAGSLVAAALLAVRRAAAPGVSTLALDEIAEAVIRDGGGVPSFLGYHGFPASICASVNDRVVHGIPSATETLALGDLVSIDCGAILDGWHGDSAITFGIATLIPVDEALSQATREAMEAGIAAMLPGNRLTDVSYAIAPSCPTRAPPAAGPTWRRVRCWRSNRCSPSAPRRPSCWRTNGPWSPPTVPAPRIGSTPSPSRTMGRESSPCSTDLVKQQRAGHAPRSNEPDHRQRRI